MSYTETKTVTGDATVYHNDEMELAEYIATIEMDTQIGAGGGHYITGVSVTFDEITINGVDIWDDEIENQLFDEVNRDIGNGEYDSCQVDLV
jgi:hypothetical protein